MTTLSRAKAKALHKSHTSFKVVSDMVKRAVDKNSPSLVKSLSNNRNKMDDCFVDLCYCHDCYKTDTISNEGITDEVFNSVDNGVPKYQYNDGWLENLKNSYYELIEASDEKLEAIGKDKIELLAVLVLYVKKDTHSIMQKRKKCGLLTGCFVVIRLRVWG